MLRFVSKSDEIVGAGPAGIATASFLSNLAREEGIPVSITIYERNYAIGGRLVLNNRNRSDIVFPFHDHSQMPLGPEDITGPSLLHSSGILRSNAKLTGIGAKFHKGSVKLGM